MAIKLFVGSLSYNVTSEQLQEAFAEVGTVVSAVVIVDRYSNQSKGFGFVEMSTDDEAKKAIAELNGKEIDGRPIVVNEARPQENRGPRPGGGGGFGGGGHRDGGGRDNGSRPSRRY
ncbi:MAG TPA: RNA-binding protein [Candidatus Saccharimonadales bacterium]